MHRRTHSVAEFRPSSWGMTQSTGGALMSVPFDRAYLASLGLQELGERVAHLFLSHARTTLELRTGHRISALFDEAQLAEFEAFIEDDDNAGASAWLDRNCPGRRAIVEQECDALTQEIRLLVPAILAFEAKLRAVPA